MSLPDIPGYELPLPETWPRSRVSWPLVPARAALLVHDMQNHFVAPFPPGRAPIAPVMGHIRGLLDAAAAAGLPVIYSQQPGGQTAAQRGLLQDFWGPGVPGDGVGAQVVEALAPAPSAVRLTKWRYSAFQKTELAGILASQGRDQLVICGVYAHLGCLLTASEAFMRDVQPFFVGDAMADFSPEHHAWALRYAAERCAALVTTRAVLEGLGLPDGDAHAAPFAVAALRAQIAAIMDEDPGALAPDDSLVDQGLDSIRLMTLMERWRQAGAAVSFVELADEPTIAAWSRLLTARRQEAKGAAGG
jgi:bifunctional isochorismate lyase / aryl carrier protein